MIAILYSAVFEFKNHFFLVQMLELGQKIAFDKVILDNFLNVAENLTILAFIFAKDVRWVYTPNLYN